MNRTLFHLLRGAALAFAPALLVAGCARNATRADEAKTGPRFDYSRRMDVTYTPASWPEPLRADLYLPAGPGPFPVVVTLHGGGWIVGRRWEMNSICRRLAAHGFVAMNITYRLLPDYHFPAPLHDAQQALRWMRVHAGELHADPARMALWGYSAGAQLAAVAGMSSPGDAGYAADAVPRAVVAGGTPADLRLFAGSGLVQDYLGGTLEQRPQAYHDASAVALASPGDAPIFLYAGSEDAIVPPANTRDLAAALAQAGVAHEVFEVPGRGHFGAFLFDDATVDAALRFLDRYLRDGAP